MLYMAGMIDVFHDASGFDYSAFVILTTAASDSVAPIHDRMPVILASDELDNWVKSDACVQSILHRPGPELEYISELLQ